MILGDLMPSLVAVFLIASFLLPLLLNYGLLEFIGSLFKKIMRPIFTLPGRSTVDNLASWLGDGTIGVLLTSRQYEEGYYTKREAAVIGTTFSVVSITFTIVVVEQVELMHMFLPMYLTILAAGLVAAIIMPRIPPLSKIRIRITLMRKVSMNRFLKVTILLLGAINKPLNELKSHQV